MKTWLFACLGVAATLLSGCRSDPNVIYLERELRKQEDELFRLEDDLKDAERELQACKRENASLRKRAGGDDKGDHPDSAASTKNSGGSDTPSLQPPVVEVPKDATPDGRVPDILRTPNDMPQPKSGPAPGKPGSPKLLPGPAETRTTPRGGTWATSARGTKIERITLARNLTGGYNADRVPGDEGITVLIEPRDTNNQVVNAPGPVTVVLLDEELRGQGDAARIAQWEFATHELAPFFRHSMLGQGFYLELRWPGEPPKHTKLHLYVRYEAEDARKLQADRAIEVRPPSGDRWTTAPGAASDADSGPALLAAPDAKSDPEKPANPAPPPKPEKPQARRPAWSPNR